MQDVGAFADQDFALWLGNAPQTAMIALDRMMVEEQGLRAFIELGWPTLEREGTFRSNWHIDAICEHLEAVSKGQLHRLMIAIPPRHMKSLTCAVFWPAYDWIINPSRRFLFASYAHNLSMRDSTKCRRVIQSPWYQARWGDAFKITSDQNTKVKFENDKGGYRLATSVGGQLTGEGGDIVCVDDASNASKVESDAIREAMLDWWKEAMSTRLNDPATGAYVIIQQRLHQRDLIGNILAESGDDYTYLCLPAEYDDTHPNRWFRDPRKENGELLWPSRVPRKTIEELKHNLGIYAAAGQLQQLPSPREGGIFKRHWFTIAPFAPADCVWSSAWDFAATTAKLTKSDPDWTANALVGKSRTTGKFYVKRVRRWRENPGEIRRLVKATADADTRRVKVTIPQDPGQAGKDQAIQYVTLLGGFEVLAEPQSGDKMSRAMGFAAQASVGNVILVEDPAEQPWIPDFLVEITSFPTGAHDDQVDAVSSAYNRLTDTTSGIIDFYEQQRDEKLAAEAAAAATPEVPYRVIEETTSDLGQAMQILRKLHGGT